MSINQIQQVIGPASVIVEYRIVKQLINSLEDSYIQTRVHDNYSIGERVKIVQILKRHLVPIDLEELWS